MPDIAKCNGDGYPVKGQCWRYIVRPWPIGQVYFDPPPVIEAGCEYFIRDRRTQNG